MPTQQPVVGTPRITITKDMVLREIMYHEFPLHKTVNGLDSVGLDEDPLKAYIQELSDPQLEYLLTHKPPAGTNDRLVVFITRTKGNGKLMGADACNPPANTSLRANACCAVFHCRRGADPVLICFTEEMYLMAYYDMPDWYQSKAKPVVGGKVYKICAVVPVMDEAWNVWHRIVRANGSDLMPGAKHLMNNSLHGEINTKGCWMLFRNYNWPRAHYEEFEEAFRALYRNEDRPHPRYRARLNALGYSTNGVCTDENYLKAVAWDKNRAYTRFTRHIVGVKYFSASSFHSLYNTDGEYFHPTATQEHVNAVLPGANAHNFQNALKIGVSGLSEKAGIITAPDSLFDDSRLHFQRQKRWAPTLTGNNVTQPLEMSWADLVLFW